MRTAITLTTLVLLASPAYAQKAPPVDEDGCIALAEKIDVKEKAKQKPTPKEKEVYEQCVDWFNCEKAQDADDATSRAAAATNEKLIRFVLKTCTGYDPKPLTAGEKFMREKP